MDAVGLHDEKLLSLPSESPVNCPVGRILALVLLRAWWERDGNWRLKIRCMTADEDLGLSWMDHGTKLNDRRNGRLTNQTIDI